MIDWNRALRSCAMIMALVLLIGGTQVKVVDPLTSLQRQGLSESTPLVLGSAGTRSLGIYLEPYSERLVWVWLDEPIEMPLIEFLEKKITRKIAGINETELLKELLGKKKAGGDSSANWRSTTKDRSLPSQERPMS